MPKRGRKNQSRPPTQARSQTPLAAPAANLEPLQISGAAWGMGVALLAGCVASAGLLAAQHLRAFDLPGCGDGGACDAAAKSPWSKVPGLGYPIAFVAASYALALLLAWVVTHGRLAAALRMLARAGALASLLYVGVSIALGLACPYCIAFHACNIGFWIVMERSQRALRKARERVVSHQGPARKRTQGSSSTTTVAAASPGGGFSIALAAFALSTVGLAWVWSCTRDAGLRKAEAQLAEATKAISNAASPAGQSATPSGATSPAAFEGRYRHGPERARVRIVMFTDYQCPDCKIIEGELMQLLEVHPADIAASIKHFPLSTLCNDAITTDVHPDACWGARAAEVAGTLGGPDGFWRVHRWLFENQGKFSEASLRAALPALGFDANRLIGLLEDSAVNKRIKDDIEEGKSLGIRNTPFIFINGVELRGWTAPKALTRAVDAALAATANTAPELASADRPPSAEEKLIEDWRLDTSMPIPPESLRHTLGPAHAPVNVVVFGDILEPITAGLDARFRALANATSGENPPGAPSAGATRETAIRYTFLNFPFDQSCNPHVPSTKFTLGCYAAKLAEAAGVAAGDGAYWNVHAFIADNPKEFESLASRNAALGELAQRFGIAPLAWLDALDLPQVAQIVSDDIARATGMEIDSIPFVFINGKRVRSWKVGAPGEGEKDLLPRLIEEAGKAKAMGSGQ